MNTEKLNNSASEMDHAITPNVGSLQDTQQLYKLHFTHLVNLVLRSVMSDLNILNLFFGPGHREKWREMGGGRGDRRGG